MDLRLWCAGVSGDPDACVAQCGCGYCDGVATDGACLAIPDFNLCRPINFESFNANCTAYAAPDDNALTMDSVMIALAIGLILIILTGVCVLGVKLYHVQTHTIYARMATDHLPEHASDG